MAQKILHERERSKMTETVRAEEEEKNSPPPLLYVHTHTNWREGRR